MKNQSTKTDINEKKCTFIVSNIILEEKDWFTIDDIFKRIEKNLKENFNIGSVELDFNHIIKECLNRLIENGFLNVFGIKYKVSSIEI